MIWIGLVVGNSCDSFCRLRQFESDLEFVKFGKFVFVLILVWSQLLIINYSHHGDVLGLVHEIFTLLPDLAEVGDTVGQQFDFFHSHRFLRNKDNAKISFLQIKHLKQHFKDSFV